MPQHPFTVAAIQPFVPQDAADNREMQETSWRLCESAVTNGARLVVLPEYFNVLGIPPDQADAAIQDCTAVRETATQFSRRHDMWLLLPLIEQRHGNRYNTAHLFGPEGHIIYTYDKTHLTIGEQRTYGLEPGKAITSVHTELGMVGVMICYDMYFPEVAQLLALNQTQLILFPSRQQSDNEEAVMLMNRVRAMDSSCYLIRSSYGQRTGTAYAPGMQYGGSCVVAPDGSVLASAGRHEGLAIAQIDPKTPWQRTRCGGMPPQPVRQFLSEDRRPELYDRIADR